MKNITFFGNNSHILLLVGFKSVDVFDLVMRDAPQSSQVEIQEYLDDISSLKLTKEESDWYNIDVAAMLNHVISTDMK